MPGSAVWRWKAAEYPQQIGASICRFSLQEDFDSGGILYHEIRGNVKKFMHIPL
jgi:hypothetical protein